MVPLPARGQSDCAARPFEAHGPSRYDVELPLCWRRSRQVGQVLAVPPQPLVVGAAGFVPEPCVLHPE